MSSRVIKFIVDMLELPVKTLNNELYVVREDYLYLFEEGSYFEASLTYAITIIMAMIFFSMTVKIFNNIIKIRKV